MRLRRKERRGDVDTRRRRGREEGERDQREDQMREIVKRMNGEGNEKEKKGRRRRRRENLCEIERNRGACVPRGACVVVARERSGERGAIDGRSAETLRDHRSAPRYSGERFISVPHLTLHFAPFGPPVQCLLLLLLLQLLLDAVARSSILRPPLRCFSSALLRRNVPPRSRTLYRLYLL